MFTAEQIAEVLVEANAALVLARERADLPTDIRNNLVAAVLAILVLEGRVPKVAPLPPVTNVVIDAPGPGIGPLPVPRED